VNAGRIWLLVVRMNVVVDPIDRRFLQMPPSRTSTSTDLGLCNDVVPGHDTRRTFWYDPVAHLNGGRTEP